jgi:hypothetical protein
VGFSLQCTSLIFFLFPCREETGCGPVYHGELGELVIDRRYAAAALCPHSPPPPALLPPQRFVPASAISLSPVETLIEAELQSLAAQQSGGATSCSSFQSDDKSVDMEEHEEEEEEDIDFYCNESIEDLKHQQHHADGSAASAAAVAATADDLDEGFFDRPPSHGGYQSIAFCVGEDGTASKTRRNLMPFS